MDLANVKGVYRYEMGRQLFPEDFQDLPVKESDWDRVALITSAGHEHTMTLCLALQDHESRELFITIVKLLKCAAEQHQPVSGMEPCNDGDESPLKETFCSQTTRI